MEMKLKDMSAVKTVTERHEGVLSYVSNLFKDSKIVESFSDRLVFEIPQSDVSSVAQCFRTLEKGKKEVFSYTFTFLNPHYDLINEVLLLFSFQLSGT